MLCAAKPGRGHFATAINKTPQRVMRARVSNGELEDLFDGASPVVAPDGHRVFYRKGLGVSPLFARSLDGDIARNTEEQLIPGCVMSFGIVPTSRGIYYVACDEQQRPVRFATSSLLHGGHSISLQRPSARSRF